VAFATKPALAVQIIRRALAADVSFSWVAADAVYGVGDVEQALRGACKGYVLGVKSGRHFSSWAGKPSVAGTAQEIARDLEPDTWQRFPLVRAPKAPISMTGHIANSPIPTPTNMMRPNQDSGPAAY
jgi:SRSO17 transposase